MFILKKKLILCFKRRLVQNAIKRQQTKQGMMILKLRRRTSWWWRRRPLLDPENLLKKLKKIINIIKYYNHSKNNEYKALFLIFLGDFYRYFIQKRKQKLIIICQLFDLILLSHIINSLGKDTLQHNHKAILNKLDALFFGKTLTLIIHTHSTLILEKNNNFSSSRLLFDSHNQKHIITIFADPPTFNFPWFFKFSTHSSL